MSSTKTKTLKQDIESVMKRLYNATFGENQHVLLISGSGETKDLVMKPATWASIVRIADYIHDFTTKSKTTKSEEKNKFISDVFGDSPGVPKMYLFNDLGCIMSKTAYRWFCKQVESAKKSKPLQFKPLSEEDKDVEAANRATIAFYDGLPENLKTRLRDENGKPHVFKQDNAIELISSVYEGVFSKGDQTYAYKETTLEHRDDLLDVLRDLKLRALDSESIREETKEYLTEVKARATKFKVEQREKRVHKNAITGTTMSAVFDSMEKFEEKETKKGERPCFLTLGYHPKKMKVMPHVGPVNPWPRAEDSKARTFHRSVKRLFADKECNIEGFDWDTFVTRMKSDTGVSKTSIIEKLNNIYLSGISGITEKQKKSETRKVVESEIRVVTMDSSSKTLKFSEYRYDVGMIIFAAYLIRYRAFSSAKYLIKCLRKTDLESSIVSFVENLEEEYVAATNKDEDEEEKPKSKKDKSPKTKEEESDEEEDEPATRPEERNEDSDEE